MWHAWERTSTRAASLQGLAFKLQLIGIIYPYLLTPARIALSTPGCFAWLLLAYLPSSRGCGQRACCRPRKHCFQSRTRNRVDIDTNSLAMCHQASDPGLCRKLSSMLAMTAAAASCSRRLYLSGLYSFSEGTWPPARPVYLTFPSACGSSWATCSCKRLIGTAICTSAELK